VRRDGRLAIAADGQVTVGATVVKEGAAKVRPLAGGKVIAGFAGGAADALALFTRFEAKLDEASGDLTRAAVELARDWRTDRALRALEALLVVGDRTTTLLISGNGDVLAPDDGLAAVGSGGTAALAAARALIRHTSFGAEAIAREALQIAAGLDIYTNDRITLLVLEPES
jgi:ATP-dependent HslUV protease subunit HslV